ncbi:hypothetical protein RHMOL_Rhmol02G0088000 [Rhododendron molle]|uniref:Uncharacterized protein n=1 Tax=Rhododendron molle TaxID=49168 RepID=A0ACC0PNC8_RHOML|nr:hypothetical protein RHMOL_Rhmol02G0088000 [Rhododendron molle]
MALVALSSVINSTLVPLLSGEVKLLRNIHTEVASIKAELQSIISFLKDADSSPKLENERAKNWVKQVRALAYQIEDVMDEYILHLAENRQRRGFIGFLRELARSITKLKPQHDIASQIQDIKTNIGEIKKRADRYGFSSLELGSTSKIEEKVHDDPRVASLFIEEDEVVGIESTREELIHRLLIRESNRTVTSLVGMGGCGKTTLAKKIFDNQKVVEHFDCQAWVSVSQSYKTEDIFRRVMKQLCQIRNECTPGGIDAMDQNSLIHMLREYLLQKRYLIVFDDVWSTDFWRFVKLALPKNSKGSQIIVTTRSQRVASFCKESSSDHVCKVEPLIEGEAWKLFCMKTFQWDFGGHCPPELEKVSRAIVRKYEGLPLAIVTIGALLSTKRELSMQRLLDTLAVNFKLLKVLDLQRAPLDNLHEEVGNLLHLRYLSVKGTNVRIIPESIGNLQNLQTLNLKYSLVFFLQIGILSRLHKLRHLNASFRRSERGGVEIQGRIGHLEELQTLDTIEANDDLIKDLENLRQLRKLGIENVKREQGKALCTAIEKMKNIRSLRVRAVTDNEILDLPSLSSPPEFLQCLHLRGRLEMLPNWILRLDNLVSLVLRASGLTGAHTIKALQALPNLIGLRLFDGYDGEQLYINVGGFPKLKTLYLEDLKELNSIIIEEGGLPVLEELQIFRCPQLEEVPSGIRKLKGLKFLSQVDERGLLRVHTPREFQDVRESQRLNDKSEEVLLSTTKVKEIHVQDDKEFPSISAYYSHYDECISVADVSHFLLLFVLGMLPTADLHDEAEKIAL